MTRKEILAYCLDTYGTSADYPFADDLETAVLRHENNRKWYALVMKVSRRKFGIDRDEVIDVVNLKLPLEMFGSFGACDGVYPAYHMNKLHWISVLLPDAPNDIVEFLVGASFEATRTVKKSRGLMSIDDYIKIANIKLGRNKAESERVFSELSSYAQVTLDMFARFLRVAKINHRTIS